MPEFAQSRINMVEGQLRPNKIQDKNLLRRFLSVPRENFVEVSQRNVAYMDEEVSIGDGRKMFAPLVTARLLQGLGLQPEDRVLVTAAGTGYTAMLIAPLVQEVCVVESHQGFLDVARKMKVDLGLSNVGLHGGAPESGHGAKAPYDKIIIDAPAQEVPKSLVNQLKAGSKLAAVVKGEDGLLEATIFVKQGGRLIPQPLFETGGEILANFAMEERFAF